MSASLPFAGADINDRTKGKVRAYRKSHLLAKIRILQRIEKARRKYSGKSQAS